MDYRQSGQTDLQVSAIGFGCWEIGGTYGTIDAAQFQRAVQRAVDVGINCFDTAAAYGMGRSEQALGWAISEADMAAIDAIFVRHGAVTVPPGWLEDA